MKKLMKKIIASLTVTTMISASLSTFHMNTLSASAANESGAYIQHIVGRGTGSPYTLSHEIVTNAVATRTIYDTTDDRILDPNNQAVVRLSSGGSGFIVGAHTIATAAHCILNGKTFIDDLSISIVGANGSVLETFDPKFYHVPYAFYEYHDTGSNAVNYDFALIEVEEDLSDYGCFDLGTILDDYTTTAASTTVSVSGFPQRANETWGTRYVGTGRVVSQDDYRLRYTVDTSGGTSGGPVYTTITTTYGTTYKVAVGIHTTGSQDYSTTPNGGIKITSKLLQFYLNNSKTHYE